MENSYFGISFLLVLLFNTTCVTALDGKFVVHYVRWIRTEFCFFIGGTIAGISVGIVCIIILVVILIALVCYCHCADGNPREACTTILNDNCCNRNSPPPAHQFPILPPSYPAPFLLPPADSHEPKQDTPGSRPGTSALAPESQVQAKDDSAPSDSAEQDQPLVEHPQHRSSLPSSSTQKKPRTTHDRRIRGMVCLGS